MLNSLRQTYSVTRPEDFKSHSQAVHCPMTKTEDAQLTALMTEQVRCGEEDEGWKGWVAVLEDAQLTALMTEQMC